jgi:hypothetical protein
MLPIVPVLFTQWSQPCAKTRTKPFVTSAHTTTNMENAKGTQANGRGTAIVVVVANVSGNRTYNCVISETSVAGSSEGVSRFIRPNSACCWALDSEASSGSR